MKTSNPYNEDRLIVSDVLADRLADFTDDTEETNESSDVPAIIQVELIYDDEIYHYDLVGWNQKNSSIKIIVPQQHLHMLVKHKNSRITLFEEIFSISHTVASKKDGLWFITIFLQDI